MDLARCQYDPESDVILIAVGDGWVYRNLAPVEEIRRRFLDEEIANSDEYLPTPEEIAAATAKIRNAKTDENGVLIVYPDNEGPKTPLHEPKCRIYPEPAEWDSMDVEDQ